MSLYGIVLTYMHKVGIIDYKWSLFACMKQSILVLFLYELYVKDFGVFVGFLSMCEVMGLNMYIALVGSEWDYEQGSIMFYEVKSKYMSLTIS